jgi:hypothetical protein
VQIPPSPSPWPISAGFFFSSQTLDSPTHPLGKGISNPVTIFMPFFRVCFYIFKYLFQGRACEEHPGVSGLLRPSRLRLFAVKLITQAKKRTSSVGGNSASSDSGSSGLASLSCWTTFTARLHRCILFLLSLRRPTRISEPMPLLEVLHQLPNHRCVPFVSFK